MPVLDDSTQVLNFLATYEQTPGDGKRGRYSFEGLERSQRTGLDSDRLNDAVNVLEDNDYVELARFLGTAPFDFGDAQHHAKLVTMIERALWKKHRR